MAAMRCCLSFILFLSLICLAYTESCARKTCVEGAFKFVPGKTYKYSYSTIAKFGDAGATGTPQDFTMHLEAHMTFLSACSVQLQTTLVNVSQQSQVIENDVLPELKDGLEKNVVNFGFYNGKIGEVCWESDESATGINIKKGILSAFQVAATTSTGFTKGTFLEVNLAGECPMIYTLNNGEDNLLYLNRTWSTSKCSKVSAVSPAQTFGLGQVFQSQMNSEPSCQHLITDGIIQSASCVERHSIKSFNKKMAPMVVRVVQHLIFKEVTETVILKKALKNPVIGTLRFELKPDPEVDNDSTTGVTLFHWFCHVNKAEVKTDTPSLFKTMVRKFRAVTDCAALEGMYRQLVAPTSCSSMSTKEKTRFILDTMTAVSSPCSVELVSRLIATDEIEMTDADLWFSSLAFVQPVTSEMLQSLKAILTRSDLPRSAYLGISTMAHNYCTYNTDCDNEVVSGIAMTILAKLNPECQTMTEDVDMMVTYLKAIGNIGPITQKIEDVLILVAQCKVKALPIRIAAVDALRFRTCDATEFSQVKSTLLTILGDSAEDTELRTTVFQILMNCPDQEVIRQSVDIMNNHAADIQLKSFMGSFIKTVMKTTATNNAAKVAKDLLSTYKINMPKTSLWSSKNFKYTVGNVTGNTPAVVDGNLLFVDSYLPRSADLGLAVELFGQQVKLIQAGARMENFEEVIERLMTSVYRKSSKNQSKISEYSMPAGKTMYEDPDFSTYLRIFGSDVAFFTYGDLRNVAADYISQQIGALDYFFGRQKTTPFEISRNIMLVDGTYQIPTTSGLPISLQVTATASGKVSGNTRLNVGGFFKPEAPIIVEGTISPSFAIEIEATFLVKVPRLSTGFRTVTTIHSSTSFGGSIEYKNRQYIRSSITNPQVKQNLLTFETVSYAIRNGEHSMIVGNPTTSKRVLQQACSDKLTKRIFGVTFCSLISSEDPIDGGLRDGLLPAHFEVWLNKTDVTLTSYNFELGFPQSDKWEFNALVDTPGSTINRRFQAMYKFDDEGKIKGALATPWKQYDLNGLFQMSPNELRLEVLEDKTRPYRLLINEVPSTGQEKNVRAQLEYRSFRNGRNQEVLLSHSTRQFTTVANLLKLLSTISVEFTEYPQMNKLVQMEVLRLPESYSYKKHLETTWNIYGPDFRNEDQKIFFHALLSTQRTESTKYNLTTSMKLRVPRSADVTPMEAEIAYKQEWDHRYNFFDGRLDTKSMFGEKSARLAWDNLWSTKKSLTIKADVVGLPRTASVEAIVKDASIDRQRSYPFEVKVNMADEKPMKVAGEFTGGKNDGSVTLDILRDDQPYMTSSHSYRYPSLMIDSQYQMHGQSGRLEATKVTPFDWTVKGNWVKGGDQWSSVVGLIPSGSNGVNAVAVFTKYTPSDYVTRKYGVDVGFKTDGQVSPVDVRTSVTVFAGTNSHVLRQVVQLSLKPTEKKFISLGDLTINVGSPISTMMGMEVEGLMSDAKALATLKFLHNTTIPVPRFVSTSASMEMGGPNKPHTRRFSFTTDADKAIPAIESVVSIGYTIQPEGRKTMNVSGTISGTMIAKKKATDDITFNMLMTTKPKNRQASLSIKTPYGVIKTGKIEVNVDETSDTLAKKQVRVTKNDILMMEAEGLVTKTKTPVAELASANWTVKVPQMTDKTARVMLKKTLDKLNKMSSYKMDVYPGEETTAAFSGMLTTGNNSSDLTLYVPKKTLKGKITQGSKKGMFGDFSVDVAWDALRNAAKHMKVSHKAPQVADDDTSGWSVEHPMVPESMASISLGQVPQRVMDIVKYSKDELHDVLTSFKVDEAKEMASHAFDGASWSTVSEPEPVVERVRRNAFAMAMAGGGGCGGCGGSGAMAMAGAGCPSSCGSSSSSFGAIASSIQSQLSQVMQDMVSKFQQQSRQPVQQSQSQTQAIYLTGGMQASYPAPSPCGSGYVQQSGGCAPAPAPQQQTHKIQIQISQPQVSYSAPSPSYSAPSPSYQQASYPAPAPQPSYQQTQAQSQAVYPSYSVSQAAPSYSPVDAYQSPYYQAQPSQSSPQYAPAPQSQSSSGSSPQSYSVPVANGHLTIQIHTSGAQAQPAAPAPQACSPGSQSPGCPGSMNYMASGSSSNNYQASASNQHQYVMSGQLPYGGGAEPRLQYCTPGSTEKGVCLNGGEASLEPTRTKRSAEIIEDMSNGIADYMKVVKKTVSGAWDSFIAQPEVQYLMDAARKITNDETVVKVGHEAVDSLTAYASDVKVGHVSAYINGVLVDATKDYRDEQGNEFSGNVIHVIKVPIRDVIHPLFGPDGGTPLSDLSDVKAEAVIHAHAVLGHVTSQITTGVQTDLSASLLNKFGFGSIQNGRRLTSTAFARFLAGKRLSNQDDSDEDDPFGAVQAALSQRYIGPFGPVPILQNPRQVRVSKRGRRKQTRQAVCGTDGQTVDEFGRLIPSGKRHEVLLQVVDGTQTVVAESSHRISDAHRVQAVYSSIGVGDDSVRGPGRSLPQDQHSAMDELGLDYDEEGNGRTQGKRFGKPRRGPDGKIVMTSMRAHAMERLVQSPVQQAEMQKQRIEKGMNRAGITRDDTGALKDKDGNVVQRDVNGVYKSPDGTVLFEEPKTPAQAHQAEIQKEKIEQGLTKAGIQRDETGVLRSKDGEIVQRDEKGVYRSLGGTVLFEEPKSPVEAGLAKAGIIQGEDGVLRSETGEVVQRDEKGVYRTPDGAVVFEEPKSPVEAGLAKAGVQSDESGVLRNQDGEVVQRDKEGVYRNPDGTVLFREEKPSVEKAMAKAGIFKDDDGVYRDEKGETVQRDENGVFRREDGSALYDEAKTPVENGLALAGVQRGEDGILRNSEGEVVQRDEDGVYKTEDGTVLYKEEKRGPRRINQHGFEFSVEDVDEDFEFFDNDETMYKQIRTKRTKKTKQAFNADGTPVEDFNLFEQEEFFEDEDDELDDNGFGMSPSDVQFVEQSKFNRKKREKKLKEAEPGFVIDIEEIEDDEEFGFLPEPPVRIIKRKVKGEGKVGSAYSGEIEEVEYEEDKDQDPDDEVEGAHLSDEPEVSKNTFDAELFRQNMEDTHFGVTDRTSSALTLLSQL